ncbi:hypothetical protein ACJX0J_026053, partial [Zea mays]
MLIILNIYLDPVVILFSGHELKDILRLGVPTNCICLVYQNLGGNFYFGGYGYGE